MYQTRRQTSLFKDKANVLQNLDNNFVQLEKPFNSYKTNLRKRGQTSSHESVLKSSEANRTQIIDSVMIVHSAKLVQKEKQNDKIKQSTVGKKNTLKDKVNVVHQNLDNNFVQLKKPLNLCKINLRKKGKTSLHESISKTSGAIFPQSTDKENVMSLDSARLVRKKKQNKEIDQSTVDKKITVINKAENCIKIEQKEVEKCSLIICKEKDLDNLKSLNKIAKSSPVYNKCLKNNSVSLNKQKKRIFVDVYDISADDDFKKEELNLKKNKKLKLLDNVKTKHISKNKKNIKKIVEVAVKKQNKIESSKNEKEIQYQFIKPLTSTMSSKLNVPEVNNSEDIPKFKHAEPPKPEENFCLKESSTNKNKDSTKLINEHNEPHKPEENFCLKESSTNKNKDPTKFLLRETTPVQEFDSILNEDSLNLGESLSKLLPHTSTPQNADNPFPTFAATPELNIVSQISKDIIVPISFEIVENCSDDPGEDEENKLDYEAAVNEYSFVLFGSPEKVAEKNIDLKIQGPILHKKIIKQISTKLKKPNIIQKKSDIEKKEEEEEENFYKSFNEQLSELDDYEFCIE